ncbi:enoyl-CoA hydratase/isomerase domain-containing protein [Sarocladium implicatum]|nr:enoyl-CoA hydratase/isomerase domain-containing protein [Sarocladium implicatum]
MDFGTESAIELEYRGRYAILTINRPSKLGALSRMQYYELGQKLREVAEHDEVYVTILVGKGRFFSAGIDTSTPRAKPQKDNPNLLHKDLLTGLIPFNMNITRAFSQHPKILVVGLNGPVVGLSAALIAHADFIYCAPHSYLFTPFTSLGLGAEGGASLAFVQRLGIAKAKEALIMSKRITAPELERCGFVNGIIDVEKAQDELFAEKVLEEVKERLGEHLIGDSLVKMKGLIGKSFADTMESQNTAEAWAVMESHMSGVPQEEFRKLASGEKRHKL